MGAVKQHRHRVATKSDYYQWLINSVGVTTDKGCHFLLMKTMHDKQFYWTIPNDDNREADGRLLRGRYEYEEGVVLDHDTSGPPSFLEFLIALSYRCEDIMSSPEAEHQMLCWFWELLNNAGLDKFDDENFLDFGGTHKIHEIINSILDRDYDSNGKGGLFPLRKSRVNQRKVEVWYQMSTYLLEKYDVGNGIP